MATELWSFLTNLKTCKQWKEIYNQFKRTKDSKEITWMFDNSILTDGTSVSFQVIDQSSFGRKELFAKKKTKNTKEKKDKDTKNENVKENLDISKYKIIGCDPGKKDILCMTDGL